MAGYAPLPAYNPGGGVDFTGFNQQVAGLGNALAQRQTQENNRNVTNALSRKDYAGAQSMSDDPAQALQIGQYQQREKTAEIEHQKAADLHLAGIAQMVQQAPPERRAEMMGKLYAAQPDVAQQLQRYGVDPNDHDMALKSIIAKTRGPVNPLEQETAAANLGLIKANTAKALRGDEPDIVRTVRAAGIDPASPEGREIIKNQIKGEGPIEQFISQKLKGVGTSQGGAPAQPQGGVQPQSYNGAPSPMPGVVLAADTGAPPGASAPTPTGTTAGSLFAGKTPEERRGIAEAMLLSPKYKAMGEQMIKDLEQGGVGKEGTGHIDKALVDRATDLGELSSIKSSFKPEFLGLEGQAKAFGLGWADYLTSGRISPDSKKYLQEYTQFATTTQERLNNRIKALAGSAVSGAEEKRMMAANPNVNMGPTGFMAQLETQIQMQKMALARYNWLKTQYKGTDAQISDLAKSGRIEGIASLDSMKGIIDKRLDQEANRIKIDNPGINMDQLKEHLFTVRRQEFGI